MERPKTDTSVFLFSIQGLLLCENPSRKLAKYSLSLKRNEKNRGRILESDTGPYIGSTNRRL